VASESPSVSIIFQDKHLLVLSKPSGLPTTSPDDGPCLAAIAKTLDPGAERMHASSRLDADVTGLVTFARTTRGIAALREARAKNQYQRLYLALAETAPQPGEGRWDFPIAIDTRDPRKRMVVPTESRIAHKLAATRYAVRSVASHGVLLELRPETGRTHQLRLHASHAGVPLLGDVHYKGKKHITTPDGRVHLARRVMLHCAELVLPRVDAEGSHTLRAPVPADMRALWTALGGEASLLDQ
jgi:23S rRNA pseudouridine1911/1915/1917 synthase